MSQNDDFWYGSGWATFKTRESEITPDFLPPFDNEKAQYEWLEGFQATWVEYPVLENFRYNENGLATDWDDVSPAIEEELKRKLIRYPEQLEQLICKL